MSGLRSPDMAEPTVEEIHLRLLAERAEDRLERQEMAVLVGSRLSATRQQLDHQRENWPEENLGTGPSSAEIARTSGAD